MEPKTSTQLPSEGLVEKLEEKHLPNQSEKPPEKTESLVEGRKKNGRPRAKIEGLKFGMLSVVCFYGKSERGKDSMWKCKCDCGNYCIRNGATLNQKRICMSSCGCFKETSVTHGHTREGKVSPEYRSWHAMIRRCFDPKNNRYQAYAMKGITVCDRWRKFSNFIEDMGLKPSRKHSIDRINNSGNYEPGNCRWATMLQQRHNRSDSWRIKNKLAEEAK